MASSVDLKVPLAAKKKAYREDFVTKPRLSTSHLEDWLTKQEVRENEATQKATTPDEAFGHAKQARAFREVLEHIHTMSNK